MQSLTVIIWGGCLLLLLLAVILVKYGRSIFGHSSVLFSICVGLALVGCAMTNVSKLHLFWLIPAAFCTSTALGAWLGDCHMRQRMNQDRKRRHTEQATYKGSLRRGS